MDNKIQMIRLGFSLMITLCSWTLFGQTAHGENPLVHTYSIVAWDAETGEVGAAVESHWFNVGSLVLHGEAGVGAVATQSFVNPSFGPEGLALLRSGQSARDAVKTLIDSDEGRAFRQLAIVDAQGGVAAYTGDNCIDAAGHLVGDGFSVQANLMEKETVWPAMKAAFENAKGNPLAERMLLALEAAQAEGGDIRGQQSAALIVMAPEKAGNPALDYRVNLRVDDAQEPVQELRRLYNVHLAYEHMNRGDLAVEAGDNELALKEYGAAMEMMPDNLEMQYWTAIALANMGETERALPMFKKIFKGDKRWKTLTPRLTKNGLLTVKQTVLEAILEQ